MLCKQNSGIIHLGIFCLVLALSGGCKTPGSRTLAEQEEQPQRGKRQWGGIALAVVGVAAGVFGGVKLSKFLLRSDFDKQSDDYLKLMRKYAENPDDPHILDEMDDVRKRIEDLIDKADSEELADSYINKQKKRLRLLWSLSC